MLVLDKLVPGGDGDIDRGIAEAELWANGVDVSSIGHAAVQGMESFEQAAQRLEGGLGSIAVLGPGCKLAVGFWRS